MTDVSRHFRGPDSIITVLDGASLTVNAHETVALTGPSGSGKSTLLACAAGLDSPNRGQVTVAGQDLASLDERGRAALRARHIGFVFQDFRLFADLTAEENIRLPLELSGRSNAHAQGKSWLQRVGLGHRAGHRPEHLSGGERQRVGVARALAGEPSLILADEPTGNLDPRTGTAIADLLLGLAKEQGTAVLIVTHDPRLAERASRRLVMEQGRIHPAP